MQMNSTINDQLLESNAPNKRVPARYQRMTWTNFTQMAFRNYNDFRTQERNLKI